MNSDLFRFVEGARSRVSSFENLNGLPGQGGLENKGAKGHAFEYMAPGGSRTLVDVDGAGIINRMWFTVANRSVRSMRSLRFQIFWDGEESPAVDVPFGDFFGCGLGRCVAYQSHLFTIPRGRSFNCTVQMPFRYGAKIVLTNEDPEETAQYFFDIDFLSLDSLADDALYFHAYWSRQQASAVGDDFVFLPRVDGKGRYLGVNFGVNRSPDYPGTGIEEGEVRLFIDGDTTNPTINGTGAEDYIGDGWGMGVFSSPYQGCTVADDSAQEFCFYRHHVPDPIFFSTDFRGAIQQLGGARADHVRDLRDTGAALIPVSVVAGGVTVPMLDMPNPPNIDDPDFPDGWVNFYRVDDWSATAYFYLDKPVSGLPRLTARAQRVDE